MKQKNNASILLAFLMMFTFIACNNEAKKEEPAKMDAAKTETAPMPAYDAAMDPVKVEAAFTKVLADTLNVKLYEVTLNPGDSVGLHTHPDYALRSANAQCQLP